MRRYVYDASEPAAVELLFTNVLRDLGAPTLVVHDIDGRAYSFDRLTKAVGVLLDRAVAAGQIRADISPEDLLRALVGMCYMHDQPGWQASVLRLADVFIDGMPQEANTSSDNSSSRVLLVTLSGTQLLGRRASFASPNLEYVIIGLVRSGRGPPPEMSESFGLDTRIENYYGKRPIGLYGWDFECLLAIIGHALKDDKEYPDKTASGYYALTKLSRRLLDEYHKSLNS